MSVLDWGIVAAFLIFILWMGIYSMRFVRGVTDFLACGRVCGRYVISVGGVACGLAVVFMIGYVESGYKSGYAYGFWGGFTSLLALFLSLTGFVSYRFRQTKAMSFGQFIEMRYDRGLRIFASCLRSIADMLANMILPALAGRFFICLLDLPETYSVFGVSVSTFQTIMFICLALAISMILMGGSVTLVITDTLQGLIAYPILAFFVFYFLIKFSWSDQILPTLMDRAPGESFMDPYDVEGLRDFNLFAIFVGLFSYVINQGVGLGAGGGSAAAKSPHEQKMAGVLGTWRNGFMYLFYLVLALAIIVFMNHKDFAKEATEVRRDLSSRITQELISDPVIQRKIIDKTMAIPVHSHQIGKDTPLSLKKNLDTPYIQAVTDVAVENPEAGIQGKVPEFQTLFHQLMLPAFLRKMLPQGLIGLFCMLVILMIISTDDSRIYSASLTFAQDVVLPLLNKPPTMKQHINIIRIVTIGVGIFYFCGSAFMSQLEYVSMFVLVMYGIWSGGAGIMVLGGLYSRFGTAKGAWASLLTGSGIMIFGVILRRNWAGFFYPLFDSWGWIPTLTKVFSTVSRPFNPWVVWNLTPQHFPINGYELSFLAMCSSITMYVLVSLLTFRRPFNLDRMLHRGKYNTDHHVEAQTVWTWKNIFSKTIGITNEYSLTDKIIAWSTFFYTFGTGFLVFIIVVLWNSFMPWPKNWWGNYFLTFSLLIPFIVAVISTIWFFIGGWIDLRAMFRDLRNRKVDAMDNGLVEGHVSLSDKQTFASIEKSGNEEK